MCATTCAYAYRLYISRIGGYITIADVLVYKSSRCPLVQIIICAGGMVVQHT